MKLLRYLYARYFASLWRRFRLVFQNFDRKPPIIIYQMGKVGSSSVYASLLQANLEHPVFHAHFLSYGHLEQIEQYHRRVGATGSIGALRYWRALREKIDRCAGIVYLISLVREPVAREISDVFQNMARHHAHLLTAAGDVNVEKTVAFLNQDFANFDESTNYACTWFDREMFDSFGLDVFATPFDHARGYTIIENDRASLLLLRMENLSAIFEAAIEEFLGCSIPLRRANETASKGHSEAYRQLLQKFSLSSAAGDKIYASRYARHFYPDRIRGELMKKWITTDQLELT